MLFWTELRILAFPCNQFAGVMPESDGDEMLCRLKSMDASPGAIMAKVTMFFQTYYIVYCYKFIGQNKCKFSFIFFLLRCM